MADTQPTPETTEPDEWERGYAQAQAKWTGMRPEDYAPADES